MSTEVATPATAPGRQGHAAGAGRSGAASGCIAVGVGLVALSVAAARHRARTS